MKSFTWVFSLLFLLFSNVVSAGLVSWSDQSFSPSYYSSRTRVSNVEIEDCSDETYLLQIQSIKVMPDIVTPGAELTLEAEGILLETVTPGSFADVQVKLGVVTLIRKRFDLCDTLENNKDKVDLQCPIEKGNLKITQKITLPKEIPKAVFKVYVNAYTADEADLACIRIKVNFRPRRFLQLGNSY
ncbi:ML domain-containing protein [Thamnidium elegans]|nr:ML domain-containing protein [Thamnidium elegans]